MDQKAPYSVDVKSGLTAFFLGRINRWGIHSVNRMTNSAFVDRLGRGPVDIHTAFLAGRSDAWVVAC